MEYERHVSVNDPPCSIFLLHQLALVSDMGLSFLFLFTAIAAAPIYTDNTAVIVSQYNVSMHDSADERSTIVYRPLKGDTVTILGIKKGWFQGHVLNGNWYNVKATGNQSGWIFENALCLPSLTEDQLIEKLGQTGEKNTVNTIFQLGIIKSQKAKPYLIALLDSQKQYSHWCIEALGAYRDTSLLPIFIDILNSPNNAGKTEAISAISNYNVIDYAKYIIPSLDAIDINVKRSAIANLTKYNNDSINYIVNSKKISLIGLLSDFHTAYAKQNIGTLSKHIDSVNGLYLNLIGEEGIYRFKGHLTAQQAVSFFTGKATNRYLDSDFFSINNISDFTVETIYQYPELVLTDEANEISYRGPYNGLFSKEKIADYSDSIMLVVKWSTFRNKSIQFPHGAYLYFIKRLKKWYLVGFEQVYG